MAPSIRIVQVNLVPLASRTWSGQLAAPTRSLGLLRFWVLTSSRSTSAVPTRACRSVAAGGRAAPPQAASDTSRAMARRRGLTPPVSAAPPDR